MLSVHCFEEADRSHLELAGRVYKSILYGVSWFQPSFEERSGMSATSCQCCPISYFDITPMGDDRA